MLAGLTRAIQDNKIGNPAMLYVRYLMSAGDHVAGDHAASRESFEHAVRRPRNVEPAESTSLSAAAHTAFYEKRTLQDR
jgi:hypothetical protein